MIDTFYPIRLNTLRADDIVTFDVYIKVGERFIHYIRLSDPLEEARILSLKGKGVRKLFITNHSEQLYLDYLEKGLLSLSSSAVSLDKKAALAHDTLVTAAENAERTLETEAGFNNQRKQMNSIAEFLSSDSKALKEVLQNAGLSVDTNGHAATVSGLALGIGARMGLTKEDLFELGTAALLHDIGKARLKFDPMKSTTTMTPEELRAYKNHPQDGADMLAGKPYISPRILGLISAHEERGNGRGYPEKKDLSKLPMPYQILSLTNQFDHFCIEKKIAPIAAIDPFFEAFNRDYSDDLISMLATVLN